MTLQVYRRTLGMFESDYGVARSFVPIDALQAGIDRLLAEEGQRYERLFRDDGEDVLIRGPENKSYLGNNVFISVAKPYFPSEDSLWMEHHFGQFAWLGPQHAQINEYFASRGELPGPPDIDLLVVEACSPEKAQLDAFQSAFESAVLGLDMTRRTNIELTEEFTTGGARQPDYHP